MGNELVSIIIPIYNVAPYIERCLDSVFNQTYENIEIILVDDCSPDNSMEIARAIIDKYKGYEKTKTVTHSKNKGLSEARNTGIYASKGDYLYFLDSDDEIFLDTIESLLKLALETDSDISTGNPKVVCSDFIESSLNLNHKYTDKFLLINNKMVRNGFLMREWNVTAWNKLVKKKLIIENNLFFEPQIYHEDELWSFKLSLVADKMCFLERNTYIYYLRNNSITTNIRPKNIKDLIFVFNEIISIATRDNNLIMDTNFKMYMFNYKYSLSLSSTTFGYLFFKQNLEEIGEIKDLESKSIKMGIKMFLLSKFFHKKLAYYILKYNKKRLIESSK